MRIGINLRGDLARANLDRLDHELDALFIERKIVLDSISNLTSVGNKYLYQIGMGMPFGRGLFHARLIYKMSATLYGGSYKKGLGRLYMIDCEIKDILDECRRRMKAA